MKKSIFIVLLISSFLSFSQENSSYLQLDTFYGNVLGTNPDASIFLQGHPTGFFISYNKRSNVKKDWQEEYNYPDFGYSFGYQNYNSDILGELYSIYGHYNFYLLDRNNKNQLILRAGVGLAYSTNPYDKETNNKNTALGTALNSSTYFKLYYQRENIFDRFGINSGLTFVHASNSNIKSPNSGVNIWAATLGLTYDFEKREVPINYDKPSKKEYTKEPLKYNFAVRTGVNESPIIGSGVKTFYVASAYVDKRISRKSAIQFGADLYISPVLKTYYELNLTIPHTNLKETSSFSRVGLFLGHELFINKMSIETQVGYYVKYPFEYDGRVYETLGVKRYFNDKWFASVRLKAHVANAETIEFGVGIRL